MSTDRWLRVGIREGPHAGRAVFWQGPTGGTTRVDAPGGRSGFHDSADAAIEDLRRGRQDQHDLAQDGIIVEVSEPVELDRADGPLYNIAASMGRPVERVERFMQEQNRRALYPAGHTWELSRGPHHKPVAILRIFDRFGTVEYQFTLDELADPDSIDRRLNRLWGDLLEQRSRELMKPVLASIREHEGR